MSESRLWSVAGFRIGKGLQKRRRQWGRKIGFGFGQRHETYLIQVFGSRSRCKAEAVLVNSILPGIGNSVGLAKKGERCPESETAMPKRAQAEVAECGCRSNASAGASRWNVANDKAVPAGLTFGWDQTFRRAEAARLIRVDGRFKDGHDAESPGWLSMRRKP